MTGPDAGSRRLTWTGFGGHWRVDLRALIARAVVVALIVTLVLVALAVGTYSLGLGEVVETFWGGGPEAARKLVLTWRLPRALFAVVAGIALGVSGAIFQSLTRNPLGSPDVIGFDAGAYTGALVVMLLIDSNSYAGTAAGAVLGGVGAAALVYGLAYRRGMNGFRFVVVGIGVSAFLVGINNYLLISTDVQRARSAVAWGFGSFSGLGFAQFLPFATLVAVLVPLVALMRRPFAQLELGDDAARALGVRAEPVRLVMTLLGVCLTAVVTAAAGPIAFVALVAPQLARRAARSPGLDLTTSALVGALVLLAADVIGVRTDISVGLVTVVLGGTWFAWLLIKEGARR